MAEVGGGSVSEGREGGWLRRTDVGPMPPLVTTKS